ncbi:hypothetical protein [Enterobacter sp. Bisph1]|uniref:hypothetical protein n=1 Tax=Enterobacter sp. Bisph1 TaxID=1274399 RepID=UPI00057C3022|nr:hypothetical protein [Enterobacter sp. Bisph1]
MRDFDMHRRRHGHGFSGPRMMKPLIIGAVVFIVLGLLVMSLWNALLPAILGVKSIGFWQALGVLVLSRILFGGLGFHGGMFGMARRRMHERWMQMTPEEREAFIQQRREGFGRRDRCGWHSRFDERAEQRPHEQESESHAKKPDAE